MNRRHLLLGAAAMSACARPANGAPPPAFPIRRGVNLGNALEAPNEGEWGYRIETRHLDAIAGAGFDGVRLPVRWDTHMEEAAPFTLDPGFFARVETVVLEALTRGLKVQLDVHHYGPLYEDPAGEAPRYRALWRQIAERFAGAPPELLFEPLNEPRGEIWTGARVTASQIVALEEIRRLHPERVVVLGGPNWNSISGLADWIPPGDPHVVATAHYYEPHAFTHQGATWESPPPRYDGVWGSSSDRRQVDRHIAMAARWAREHGLAMQIGEFGVIHTVDPAQRALWAGAVAKACEAHGLGWCVWDFAGTFPIYDVDAARFIPGMLPALMD